MTVRVAMCKHGNEQKNLTHSSHLQTEVEKGVWEGQERRGDKNHQRSISPKKRAWKDKSKRTKEEVESRSRSVFFCSSRSKDRLNQRPTLMEKCRSKEGLFELEVTQRSLFWIAALIVARFDLEARHVCVWGCRTDWLETRVGFYRPSLWINA